MYVILKSCFYKMSMISQYRLSEHDNVQIFPTLMVHHICMLPANLRILENYTDFLFKAKLVHCHQSKYKKLQ